MSTSITVVNRNRTLPPLLLPDLRSVTDRQPYGSAAPLLLGLKRGAVGGNDLESLANVATKRLKLSANLSAHLVTPPPTAPVSAAISPSPSYVTFQETTQCHKGASPSPEGRKQAAIASGKRQRIGPSCDDCRLKKIKCDASIEIVLQDDSLTDKVSDKLHHVFSPAEVSEHLETILKNVQLPEELMRAGDSAAEDTARRPVLIKHIDKIVLFKPCTSCRKRKSGSSPPQGGCYCLFSKGFTRTDINVFSRIANRIKGKAMAEMDIEDYRAAGF